MNRLLTILGISMLLLSGCSKKETYYEPAGPEMATLKHQYKLAVMDAKIAEPWEIYRSLVAVNYYGDSSAGQGNLTWSADSAGRMRVLVVSWMQQSSTKYWPVGQTFKTVSYTHLTLPTKRIV